MRNADRGFRTGAVSLCLAACGALSQACHGHEHAHDHSDAHPAGHDHHAPDHGHGDQDVITTTLWSETLELFAEHAPAVAGQQTPWLVHLTALEDFQPVRAAHVALTFSGPASLHAETTEAIRPGIFRLMLTPTAAGDYRGELRVSGDTTGVVTEIPLRVRATPEVTQEGHGHEHGDQRRDSRSAHAPGVIEFLKEQQWGVPFATAFVAQGTLLPAIEVAGRVDTPPGGQAEVSAPITGRLVATGAGLPHPGQVVKRGQVLALLSPAPASPEGAASAELAVTEAQARLSAARLARKRAEQLFRDDAIPQRALEDARRELEVATEALSAARRAAGLYAAVGSGGRKGAWQLRAPIDGVLVAVHARPGAAVSPGTRLFRIVDDRELWIVARVPEQDASHLRTDRRAAFQIAGDSTWQPIEVAGDNPSASLVTVGRAVDPHARTVDVIYALHAAPTSLRVDGLVRVSLPVGKPFAGIVVPKSAVIDREGRSVLYVQIDGEHFEERTVRTGPEADARIAIASGLRAGERIVTQGAHLVRLSDRAKGAEPHGHIHQ